MEKIDKNLINEVLQILYRKKSCLSNISSTKNYIIGKSVEEVIGALENNALDIHSFSTVVLELLNTPLSIKDERTLEIVLSITKHYENT